MDPVARPRTVGRLAELFWRMRLSIMRATCREAWALDPTDPYVAMMLGQLEYMSGDHETGRKMHARAIALDRDEAKLTLKNVPDRPGVAATLR